MTRIAVLLLVFALVALSCGAEVAKKGLVQDLKAESSFYGGYGLGFGYGGYGGGWGWGGWGLPYYGWGGWGPYWGYGFYG